jgi:hypothetical protein
MERKTAYNKGIDKRVGLVLRINLFGKFRHLRQGANRSLMC